MSADLFEVEEMLLVDRSTLANYAECPAMGRFIETGEVPSGGRLADVGNGVHDAFSETITQYLDSGGAMDRGGVAEVAQTELLQSRPDVQPEVIRAARPALWPWARMIAECPPDGILLYDGGSGERCGQLARDFEDLGVRVTSEIDLCLATASPEVIEEIDYKSGHKQHTAESVKDDFQFQLHAWLLFDRFPDVKCVRIRVWNTRTGRLTYSVEFTREMEAQSGARIRSAVQLWLQNRNSIPELTTTWPEIHRCTWCPAALRCSDMNKDIKAVLENPVSALDRLVILENGVKELRKTLSAAVRQTGSDIIASNGKDRFGTEKPKANRKPIMSVYSTKKESEEQDGDGTDGEG